MMIYHRLIDFRLVAMNAIVVGEIYYNIRLGFWYALAAWKAQRY
jgi:hypothetical protein